MNPRRRAFRAPAASLILVLLLLSVTASAQYTWKNVGTFPMSVACGYFFDADHGLIGLGVRYTPFDADSVKSYGIYRTTDGGQRWLPCVVPLTLRGDVTSIRMQTDKIGYASIIPVDTDGARCVWKTTDGGLTWNAPFDLNHDITDVYAHDSVIVHTLWDEFYGRGFGGFEYSIDSGQTWNFVQGDRGNGIAFSDAKHGVITQMNWSQGGPHWHTTDGGVNWLESASQDQFEAWSVYALPGTTTFFTANEGQIGDENGNGATDHQYVNWSTDGGKNWAHRVYFPHMQFTGGIAGMDSVLYFQTDTATYFPADPAVIRGMYRSTDLGASWKFVGGPSHSRDSRFVVTGCGGEVVYAFDADGNVWKTTDGGDGTLHPQGSVDMHLATASLSLQPSPTDLCKPVAQSIPFYTTGCGTASLDSVWISGSPGFSVAGSQALPRSFGSDSVVVQYQRSELGAMSDSAVLHIAYSINGTRTVSDIPLAASIPAVAPTGLVLPARATVQGSYAQPVTLTLRAILPQFVMDSLQQSGLATMSVSYGFDPSQLSYTFFASPATLATSRINQPTPGVLNVDYRNSGWSYSPGDLDLGNVQFTVQTRQGSETPVNLRNLSIVTKNGGVIYPCLGIQEDNQWQVIVANTMSVSEEALPSTLKLTPSPFHDHIAVSNESGNVTLTLCDLLGREIAHFDATSGESQWNTSQLQNGIYVIYWQENGRLHSIKLTKVE